jgi:GntR family transcriptional regulator/MocR family aminotransferase
VAIEDPCWEILHDTLVNAGLEPVPIPVDEDGLRVEELEHADVSAVAISPAHQYPSDPSWRPSVAGH